MSHPTGLLHHFDINVSNLEKSAEFWGWFLGLLGWKKTESWPKGVSYKLGETYLTFVQVESEFADDGYHRKRVGLNHLAFHASSKSHCDEIMRLLKNKGVTVLYEDEYPHAGGPNYYAGYFEDPVDRIKGEIVAP
jgi:catechol 2,3-dioxygenase-like lactoylglutathione lyase family enzyme